MKSRIAAVVLVVVVSLFVSGQISQAGINAVNVQGSKKADSGYSTSVEGSVDVGKTKIFYAKVENPASEAADVALREDLNGDTGFKVNWFKGKTPKAKRKITGFVRGDGFAFRVKPGKSKVFAIEVTNRDGTELCLQAILDIQPSGQDSTVFDLNGPACSSR